MGNRAKQERTTQRTQQKQAKDIAKQKERNREPKTKPKQVSKKQQQELAELAKIKKEFLAENPFCFTTGEYVTADTCDLSHIIPRGNKKYVTNRLNLVLEKREVHQLWEVYKAAYRNQYPIQFDIKLERIKQLSETEYQKLKQKANG
jgi:hypothetical protein